METTTFIGKDGKKHTCITQYYEIGTYVIIDNKTETQGSSVLSEAQIHSRIRKDQKWFPGESSDIPEKPKEIKSVWDNDGKTADRYTVVFKTLAPAGFITGIIGGRESLSLSENPTHPQGVSLMGIAIPGEHLGKRIQFYALPLHVIRHVIDRLKEK